MTTKKIRSLAVVTASSLVLLSVMRLAALAAVPTVASVSPSFATVGSGATTLTVNGSNFDANAMVNFNGMARATTYVSSTQLTASLPASDFTTTGTFSVTVNNPSAGGGTSNALAFTVGNLIPITSSIFPSSLPSGSSAFTMTVNGSNFMPGSVVHCSGLARATGYTSSTQLTAAITAADIGSPGTFNVTVVNPGPGGGTSNAQVFTTTGAANPVPIITMISPASAVAGSNGFILNVYGDNFNANSMVRFNGLARTTTLVSSTHLTAAIPASDVAMSGNHAVHVMNTAPGGGTSNAVLFTVSPLPITPGLPNTGFGPEEDYNAGMAMAIGIALIGLVAVG